MTVAKDPSEAQADSADDEDAGADGGDSIAEFLSQFSGGGHQFIINRLEPRQIVVRGQPKRIGGHLGTLHTPPAIDDLREWWGGGVYEIRVNGRTPKGPRILACRKVEIAGDPKLPDSDPPPEPAAATPPPPAESPALVQQILEHTFEDKRRVEERFERERQRVLAERQAATPDPALLQTTLGAIERSQRDQIETLRQQLDRRDREMAELRQQMEVVRGRSSPLENPEVLKFLFGRGQEDAGRTADQLRHELQLERDRHQREIEAERDRREREVSAERREHEQQLRLIERLHSSELENLRSSHAQLVATKDEHIARLNEEIRTLRSASRPPDALGDLERVGKVVHAVRNFIPGLGDEEGPAGWERLLDRAKPIIDRVADNLSKPAPVQVIQTAPAPRHPFAPGLIPLRRPMPRVAPPSVRPSTTPASSGVAAHPAGARPTGAATSADPVAGASATATAPTSIVEGLRFLESAFKGEQPVEDVSRTATSLFPRAELRALVDAGPDQLMAEIERQSPDSILASSGGKRYLRDLLQTVKAQLDPAP